MAAAPIGTRRVRWSAPGEGCRVPAGGLLGGEQGVEHRADGLKRAVEGSVWQVRGVLDGACVSGPPVGSRWVGKIVGEGEVASLGFGAECLGERAAIDLAHPGERGEIDEVAVAGAGDWIAAGVGVSRAW